MGVYGYATDSIVTRVGPICASIADVQNGATGPNTGDINPPALRYRTSAGPQTGDGFERICPAGMAVRGFRGRAASGINRLEVDCQRIDRNDTPLETSLGPQGGTGGKLFSDRCVGRSAMVGPTYEADWVLERLCGVCTEPPRRHTTSRYAAARVAVLFRR